MLSWLGRVPDIFQTASRHIPDTIQKTFGLHPSQIVSPKLFGPKKCFVVVCKDIFMLNTVFTRVNYSAWAQSLTLKFLSTTHHKLLQGF